MTQLDDVLTRGDPAAGQPEDVDLIAFAEVEPVPAGGAGLLTPADVHNKVFATVRLREGYDLSQVDTFLYQVETTLRRVLRENAQLRARLASVAETPRAVGDRASRIVALAQQTADRAIAEAHDEARQIITAAREQADAVRREAREYGVRVRESLESQIGQLRGLLVDIDERDDTY